MVGNKFLLDTNAIIALQRDNEALKSFLQNASNVFLPVVAIGELYFGAYKSTKVEDNRKSVVAFMAERTVLKVDDDTADIYGQIKQVLRAKGRPIPENDIWIAALAIQYDLILLSLDAHFSEIDNLTTQTW